MEKDPLPISEIPKLIKKEFIDLTEHHEKVFNFFLENPKEFLDSTAEQIASKTLVSKDAVYSCVASLFSGNCISGIFGADCRNSKQDRERKAIEIAKHLNKYKIP
ncbi:hypothetical protein ACE3MQ_06110 [Paenibacillus lentus]|uniref:hypothetical protein n=1 Tax=Paenibacillus lentus TaxID=1338368 RepID=UPI0036479314